MLIAGAFFSLSRLMKSPIRVLLIILAILGLADCLAIAGAIHFSIGQCSGLGSCDKVLNSSYATLMGYSLWKLGAFFYVVYLGTLLVAVLKDRNSLLLFCLTWLSGGVLFSGYLIYLQAFKIEAWCPLCLLSAGIQFLSLMGCLYLWFSRDSSSRETWPITAKEFITTVTISLLVLAGIFYGSERVFEKIAEPEKSHHQYRLVAQLGEREVILADFPEYMTMKHEFEQFIWGKAKEWYRAELLNHAAQEQGFANVTEFVHRRYTDSGGIIDIGPEETRRRFAKLKAEYQDQGGELPSDEKIFEELQLRYQTLYDQFVEELTDKVEQNLQAQYLLKPSSVNLAINPEEMPVLGPKNAPIQIIEISDFHCSHCRKMHQNLEEVIQEIGSENVQIAYVNHYWDELPQNMNPEQATLTMRAAYAAWKQGKFWEFAHDVFEKQDQVNIDSLEALKKIAEAHQLNLERFTQDLSSPKAKEFIQTHRQFQKQAFADKPPTLLINGFFVKADRNSILAKIKELNLLPQKK